MPAFLLPLLASALPGVVRGITGLVQGRQARDLKPENYTPPAFTEALGLQRQAASSGLPGAGQQLDRLAQGQAATMAQAVRAGNSASSVLGTLAATDANRNQALSSLAVDEERYRQQQQQGLRSMLGQQAQYQQQDKQNFDRAKASLTEAKIRNLTGAVDNFAAVGAYALGKPEQDVAARNSQYGTGFEGSYLDADYIKGFRGDPSRGAFSLPAPPRRPNLNMLNPYAGMGMG